MDNNKTENRDLELTELTKLEDQAPVAQGQLMTRNTSAR